LGVSLLFWLGGRELLLVLSLSFLEGKRAFVGGFCWVFVVRLLKGGFLVFLVVCYCFVIGFYHHNKHGAYPPSSGCCCWNFEGSSM